MIRIVRTNRTGEKEEGENVVRIEVMCTEDVCNEV